MFTDHGRPFYQSTEILQLNEINHQAYQSFIRHHFSNNNISITESAASTILSLCYSHTYYVQYVCNKLFGNTYQAIDDEQVLTTFYGILNENQPIYHTYKQVIPFKQFALLKALAKEGYTTQPLAGKFINSHLLGAVSSIESALKALVQRDLVHRAEDGYRVSDVFLMHWLRL